MALPLHACFPDLSFLNEARGATAESQMRRTGRFSFWAPSFVDSERLSNPKPSPKEVVEAEKLTLTPGPASLRA